MIKDEPELFMCRMSYNIAQMNLLNFLEVLSDHDNIDKNYGLCENIGCLRRSVNAEEYLDYTFRYKISMMERFKYICWLWGRDQAFPVPCPSDRPDILDSEEAYHTLPKYEGEYGQSRYELLQFALDYQTAELSF